MAFEIETYRTRWAVTMFGSPLAPVPSPTPVKKIPVYVSPPAPVPVKPVYVSPPAPVPSHVKKVPVKPVYVSPPAPVPSPVKKVPVKPVYVSPPAPVPSPVKIPHVPSPAPPVPSPAPRSPLARRPSRSVSDVAQFKENNYILSENEVCVGHALAVLNGQRVSTRVDYWYNDIHKFVEEQSKIPKVLRPFLARSRGEMDSFLLMVKIMKASNYPPLLSGGIHNVKNHATVVNISSRDGKHCNIWYVDPHGWNGQILRKQYMDFENKYGHRTDWFGDHLTLDKVITEPSPVKSNDMDMSFSIKRLLIVWKKSPRYQEILNDLNQWRTLVTDGRKLMYIEDHHFMCAMFILKKLLNADHVTIISPHVSMNKRGPQSESDDGVCVRVKKNKLLTKVYDNVAKNEPRGSCVVWSHIYSTYVRNYHSRFSNDHDLIVFLKENPFVGEISAFELLGKVAFDKNIDTDIKKFLLKIFEIMPDESELECKDTTNTTNGKCLTKYHSDILETYDKIVNHWNKYKVTNPITTVRFLNQLANNDKKRAMSIHTFNIQVARIYLKFFWMKEITLFNLIFILLSCKHKSYFG